MQTVDRAPSIACESCASSARPFPFQTAFQPMVDLLHGKVFAYEALVRGLNGEGAGAVLSRVTEINRYAFDQSCRRQAIETATRLGIIETGAALSINIMPNAIYNPENCVRASIAAARRAGLPASRIIFEIVEQEQVVDAAWLDQIFRVYRQHGFRNAIDDFGAGFAGLTLLADLAPDILKLDMALTRNIESSAVRRAIVAGMTGICGELGVILVAEGIETQAELASLRALGVRFVQGYLFGRPVIGSLPRPVF